MAEENKQSTEQQFAIQRVYIKDISFESPNSPAVFAEGEWKPEVNIQLNTTSQNVGQDLYEVVIMITVTAKHGDKTAFLVEVKQAGVFMLSGFTKESMSSMLNAFCPETLFPFAREVIADLVTKGGFPQLLLSPVNFNAVYEQQLKKKAAAQSRDTAH